MAAQQAEFTGELWFFTRLDAPKIDEVRHRQEVNLSYSEAAGQRYVSISGYAEISRDRAQMKKLWAPVFQTWFPKGVDDPKLGLLKINITKAEYWDPGSGRMVQLADLKVR
jgi:general stress protein 26